jgi:hypothetical protein
MSLFLLRTRNLTKTTVNGAMLFASQKLAWPRCIGILMVRKWNGLQYHGAHTDLRTHMFSLAHGSKAWAIRKAHHRDYQNQELNL